MATGLNVKEALEGHLRELHLPAFRSGYEELARQAQQEALSYERYLLGLAERECQERRQNRIERLLRESRLPLEKSWPALESSFSRSDKASSITRYCSGVSEPAT